MLPPNFPTTPSKMVFLIIEHNASMPKHIYVPIHALDQLRDQGPGRKANKTVGRQKSACSKCEPESLCQSRRKTVRLEVKEDDLHQNL